MRAPAATSRRSQDGTDRWVTMHFVFTIKTKNGAVTTIEVEALDQAAAEEKVKRENPTCTVTRVEKT